LLVRKFLLLLWLVYPKVVVQLARQRRHPCETTTDTEVANLKTCLSHVNHSNSYLMTPRRQNLG